MRRQRLEVGDWAAYKNPVIASKFDGMVGIISDTRKHPSGWVVNWVMWPDILSYKCQHSGEEETYLLPIGQPDEPNPS